MNDGTYSYGEYDRLQLSYTKWTRVLGTDVEIRLTPDAQGVEYREVRNEPPKPSWWPPRRGDVFENVHTHTRYCVSSKGIMSIDSGHVFGVGEFGHGDGALHDEQPLWRLLIPAFNRAGEDRRADGL